MAAVQAERAGRGDPRGISKAEISRAFSAPCWEWRGVAVRSGSGGREPGELACLNPAAPQPTSGKRPRNLDIARGAAEARRRVMSLCGLRGRGGQAADSGSQGPFRSVLCGGLKGERGGAAGPGERCTEPGWA